MLALDNHCHVVCEKPMGLQKSECEKVIYKALQASKHVFCVMQNRYSPPAVLLKSVIQEQCLGEIYLVQINCYWNRDERYYHKSKWKECGQQNVIAHKMRYQTWEVRLFIQTARYKFQ